MSRWYLVNRYSPNCGAGRMKLAWTVTTTPCAWVPGPGSQIEPVDDRDELSCVADTRDGVGEETALTLAASPALLAIVRELANVSLYQGPNEGSVARRLEGLKERAAAVLAECGLSR